MKTSACFYVCALSVLGIASARAQNRPFDPPIPPLNKAAKQWVSTHDFVFTDVHGQAWKAPAKTKTDGASIPRACWSLIGQPLDDRYVGAALVHDAFCGEANSGQASYHKATWQQVHRMFYDACLAGGTPPVTALLMYAAVWWRGPRNWTYPPPPTKPKKLKYVEKGSELAVYKHAQLYAAYSLYSPQSKKTKTLTAATSAQYMQEQELVALDLSLVPDSITLVKFREVVAYIKQDTLALPSVVALDSVLLIKTTQTKHDYLVDLLNKTASSPYLTPQSKP